MIDTHAHILPGVDDGPRTMEKALGILEIMEDEGVQEVIATSHMNRKFNNKSKHIEAFKMLEHEVLEREYKLKLHLGAEISLNEETVLKAKENELVSLGNSNYLLIELPVFGLYPVHYHWLEELKTLGYRLILAHVERYDYLVENAEVLNDFMDRNIRMQMNADYILNKKTRKKAVRLIHNGYIQLIASDTHDSKRRKPNMSEARSVLEKQFDAHEIMDLFEYNARRILKNESIETKEYKVNHPLKYIFKNNIQLS